MSTRKRIAVWENEAPASAYLLGVLAGDGHVHVGPHNGWLVLTAIDSEFVRSFHEALVATVPDVHPTVSTEARLHISADPASGLQRRSWVWDAKALSIDSQRRSSTDTVRWAL